MNKTTRLFATCITAGLLSMPAFAAKLNTTDCINKVKPAYQSACQADNDLRTKCNATSNPIQCYNNKGVTAAAPAPQPVAQQAAKPSPCQAEFDAWQKLAKNPTPNTTKDAQQKKFAWDNCMARNK